MTTPVRRPPFPFFGDRFELVDEYSGAEGWSGRVREADGTFVVLKVLPEGTEPAEASLLASLDHPRIPRILELGELPDGRPYLVRQFLDGEPLDLQTTMSAAASTRFATEFLQILAYVHLRGILHLDLKPANILRQTIDGEDHYFLLDFGLGQRVTGASQGGTPFFAAPERHLGLPADPRSDLFSLGVLLYCVTRTPGSTLPMQRHRERFPRLEFLTAVDGTLAELPSDLARFVARLLGHRPSDRFLDAQEALEAVAGRSGRPSLGLLRPDAITIHGPAVVASARALSPDENLCIRGEDEAVRSILAVHAMAELPSRAEIDTVVGPDHVLLRQGEGQHVTITIPALELEDLVGHLGSVLGLAADMAAAAAAALHDSVGELTISTLEDSLRRLVESGSIVPDGTRWIWPDAISGRVDGAHFQRDGDRTDGLSNPTEIREAAARGFAEQAISAYRRTLPDRDRDRDRVWRAALAEGLILGGEPARCLPFVADLAVHHARALLDLGHPLDAARRLEAVEDLSAEELLCDDSQRQRLLASIEQVRGRPEEALARLDAAADGLSERITRSQVLLSLDRAEEARRLSESVVSEMRGTDHRFLLAAAHTSLAECHRALGDLDAADKDYRVAQGLLLEIGHVRHSATAATNLGVIAKDRGEFEAAIEHHRRARAMFEHVGDRRGVAFAIANHGLTNLAMGDPANALRRLTTAFASFEELGVRQHHPLWLVRMAEAHAALGESREAQDCLARSGPPESGPLVPIAARVARKIAELKATDSKATDSKATDSKAVAETREPESAHPSTVEASIPRQGDDDATVMVIGSSDSGVPKEVFRTFLAVNRRLAAEADLQRAMNYLLDAAVTLTGGRSGFLLVAREGGLRQEFRCGETSDAVLAFSRSMVNRAMQQRRTQTAEDALADRELLDMPSVQNLRRRSAICAPFLSAAGHHGALYVEHPSRAGLFGDSEREHLEILADQAAIAVDRMLREEALTVELQQSQRELAVARRGNPGTSAKMLGHSPVLQNLKAQITKVAASELPVLIRGETGAGKELVARALHDQSSRNRKPFVAENCSAIPANLLESEFFGHQKGAFTGADEDRAGLLEMASGGTLFLDEIGDMPMALQVKLLRALQESKIRRLGSTETVAIDIRLVSATHKNLRGLIDAEEFREDLYFRIAAVEIVVPPLRERGEDIVILAQAFLDTLNSQHGRSVSLTDDVRNELRSYPWPGNVRELHHVISRAFLLADGDTLDGIHLPESNRPADQSEWPAIPLQEAESRTIQAALRVTGGDKTKAAKLLGISRTAIYEKLRRSREG